MGGGQIGLVTRPTVKVRKHSGNYRGRGLRQVLGEIVIYGHAIRRNGLQSALLTEALDKAYSRCADAMNYAFASGQLEYVKALSRVVRKNRRYLSGKLRIKVAVASMPDSLGRILNSILVRRKITDPSPISSHLQSSLYETIDFLSETARLSE
jgi:hypothetical protein